MLPAAFKVGPADHSRVGEPGIMSDKTRNLRIYVRW